VNGWHETEENWHGPLSRTEIAVVWDVRTQSMVEKIVDYRLCGCVVWSDLNG
jgi:hypothetical protein